MHGMDSILTAVGWASGLSIFLQPSQRSGVPWMIAFYTSTLWMGEVAWHRSCLHCSILSLCKTGNIPWSALSCKPCLNIACESINTLGAKPAWTWPEPSLQACLIGYRQLLQLWVKSIKSLPQESLIPSWILHWLSIAHLFFFDLDFPWNWNICAVRRKKTPPRLVKAQHINIFLYFQRKKEYSSCTGIYSNYSKAINSRNCWKMRLQLSNTAWKDLRCHWSKFIGSHYNFEFSS